MTKQEQNQEFNQIPEHEAEPFAVYRDGELDQEWLAEQKRAERIDRFKHVGNTVLSSFKGAVGELAHNVGKGVSEVLDELDARSYDSRHNTNYTQQLLQKRRNERNSRFAARLGLNS
jgi:hypothetical protein